MSSDVCLFGRLQKRINCIFACTAKNCFCTQYDSVCNTACNAVTDCASQAGSNFEDCITSPTLNQGNKCSDYCSEDLWVWDADIKSCYPGICSKDNLLVNLDGVIW